MDSAQSPPRSFDLSLRDISLFSSAIRHMGDGAASMEEVARRVVDFLHDRLADRVTRDRLCVMARFYKTQPFGSLDEPLQRFALRALGEPEAPRSMKCLTLLATRGELPEWNDRHASRGHQAVPLRSEEVILRFPMISALIQQFGLDIRSVLEPEALLLPTLVERSFGIFHVPVALGSPHIPAQDFVERFGVQSCVGFGGMLPTGNIFSIILFTRMPVAREVAELFAPLALSIKLAVLPYDEGRVFDTSQAG